MYHTVLLNGNCNSIVQAVFLRVSCNCFYIATLKMYVISSSPCIYSKMFKPSPLPANVFTFLRNMNRLGKPIQDQVHATALWLGLCASFCFLGSMIMSHLWLNNLHYDKLLLWSLNLLSSIYLFLYLPWGLQHPQVLIWKKVNSFYLSESSVLKWYSSDFRI